MPGLRIEMHVTRVPLTNICCALFAVSGVRDAGVALTLDAGVLI